MNIWNLLKAYVREFEIANDVQFSDGSWQRIKKLEADIQALHWQAIQELRDAYNSEKRQRDEGLS